MRVNRHRLPMGLFALWLSGCFASASPAPVETRSATGWVVKPRVDGWPRVFGPQGERGVLIFSGRSSSYALLDGDDIAEVEDAFRLAYQKEEGGLMERHPIAGLLRIYRTKVIGGRSLIVVHSECFKDESEAVRTLERWRIGPRSKRIGGGDCYGEFTYNRSTGKGSLFVH